ncbi:hypothetical protein FOZ63_003054, partial [Perkinsus olseni]
DYPRNTKYTDYNGLYNRTFCLYRKNEILTEEHTALEFYVKNKSVRTHAINCPKIGNETAFRAGELPWNFDEELRRLYGIANKIQTFKPGASWIPTDSMLEAAEGNDEDAIKTINTIEGVCSAVVTAMKKYFGTFEELCSTYRHVCGEALTTTWLEDWVIDEQDVYGRNLVNQRH